MTRTYFLHNVGKNKMQADDMYVQYKSKLEIIPVSKTKCLC